LAALGLACLAALALVVWIKSLVWERLARLEDSFASMQSDSYLLTASPRNVRSLEQHVSPVSTFR
jgi:hypothetical protein